MKINDFLRVVENNIKVLVFEEDADEVRQLIASGLPEELLDIGTYFEKQFHIAKEGVEGTQWKQNFENYHVRSFYVCSPYKEVVVICYHPTLCQKLDQEYLDLKYKIDRLDKKIRDVDLGLCDDIDVMDLNLLKEQLHYMRGYARVLNQRTFKSLNKGD